MLVRKLVLRHFRRVSASSRVEANSETRQTRGISALLDGDKKLTRDLLFGFAAALREYDKLAPLSH